MGIRPEHLSSEPGDRPGLENIVDFVEMLGSEKATFGVDVARLHFFDPGTGDAITGASAPATTPVPLTA